MFAYHFVNLCKRSAKLGENMKEAFIETFRREQKKRLGSGAVKCNSVWLSFRLGAIHRVCLYLRGSRGWTEIILSNWDIGQGDWVSTKPQKFCGRPLWMVPNVPWEGGSIELSREAIYQSNCREGGEGRRQWWMNESDWRLLIMLANFLHEGSTRRTYLFWP